MDTKQISAVVSGMSTGLLGAFVGVVMFAIVVVAVVLFGPQALIALLLGAVALWLCTFVGCLIVAAARGEL